MIYLRVPPELQVFLRNSQEDTAAIQIPHRPHQTLKDIAESCGIPHVEIGKYFSEGQTLPPSARVSDGTVVRLEVSREVPEDIPSFVLDVHLTRLARYLRILGFNSAYEKDYEDDEIADIALEQNRVVLTRDRGLLKRTKIKWGYWVRSQIPKEQLRETAERYQLFRWFPLKSRCSHCNSLMVQIQKELVEQHLPRYTKLSYDVFYRCSGCSRIYWEGAHYPKIQELRRMAEQSRGI